MRSWIFSASLIAAMAVETSGQDTKPIRPTSYPIALKADEVREFVPLNIDYAGLRILSAGLAGIPIMIEPGVTGMVLIGNGSFRFAPDAGEPIEGHFRGM